MIGNLQETVSQLVYLKRDVKKLKEQISLKDTNIADIEKVTKLSTYVKLYYRFISILCLTKFSTIDLSTY